MDGLVRTVQLYLERIEEDINEPDKIYIHLGELRQLLITWIKLPEKSDKPFDHIERHRTLHKELDELVADHITHTTKLPSNTTLFEFMKWSHEQTIKPTERK